MYVFCQFFGICDLAKSVLRGKERRGLFTLKMEINFVQMFNISIFDGLGDF